MNLIFITLDSLNRHFLAAYGNDWVRTPNLADFARRSLVFDNHYAGSVPCMPARREIWSGTQEMFWRWHGPLEPWDQTPPQVARLTGGVKASMLVTDHYHFFEWGSHGYQNDFDGYEFIRGHECDNWRTDPPAAVPDWARVMVERDAILKQYVVNAQDYRREEDFMSPRVFSSAVDWLGRNAGNRPFYLHIDSFDPHEPFHVPEPYRSMYTDEDYRKYSPWPIYGRTDQGPGALPPQEVEWVRAQYAGKLTMVDRWFGRLMETMDRLKLWDDTAVVVTTDHGHYLGDNHWMGKPPAPLHRTLCHIPLMVWFPGGPCNGRRTGAITQTVDLYATIIETLGGCPPVRPNIHSRSLLPVIQGAAAHRDVAVYGYCNSMTGITDGTWAMTRVHDPDAAPSAVYSHSALAPRSGWRVRHMKDRQLAGADLQPARIPGVECPVWRTVIPPHIQPTYAEHLWDVANDPQQVRNVAAAEPRQAARLADALRDYMRRLEVPPEQFARLHL